MADGGRAETTLSAPAGPSDVVAPAAEDHVQSAELDHEEKRVEVDDSEVQVKASILLIFSPMDRLFYLLNLCCLFGGLH